MSIPLGVRYFTGHWENTDSRAEWLCPQERNHRHASLCDTHWPWSPCLTLWMSRLFASFPEAVTSCWTLECFPCFQALTTQQGLCALCVKDKLALGADISHHSVICSVRLQPCLLCLPPMGRLSRLPGDTVFTDTGFCFCSSSLPLSWNDFISFKAIFSLGDSVFMNPSLVTKPWISGPACVLIP